jgi:arylsulfatase A-like enzyme
MAEKTSREDIIRAAIGHGAVLWTIVLVTKAILSLERYGWSSFSSIGNVGEYLFRDAVVAMVWTVVAVGLVVATRAHRTVRGALVVLAVLAALYSGLNIGFFRSFSTPLNRGLLSMAGGEINMGDSALEFITPSNLWPLALVLVAAVIPPLVAGRLPKPPLAFLTLAALASMITFLFIGPNTRHHGPPLGLDRNAIWEATLLPFPKEVESGERLTLDISGPIPRGSIVDPTAQREDLSHLSGVADGMNVVLVVLESTSAAYIAAYGENYEDDPMPNVSALTENALVFDAWYAPVPTSMKCMFSYLCSMYPYPDAIAESQLAPEIPCHSLPEVLAESGFKGSFVTSAKFTFNDKTRFLRNRGYSSLRDANNLAGADMYFSNNWGVAEDAALGEMQRFLHSRGTEERFFLTYVPIFPHHPYALPPDEPRRFGDDDFGRYRDGLAYTDRIVGELIQSLEDNGQLDNTLVMVIGDHGEPFNQHLGNRMHSNAIYEENVRVPAIIYNRQLFPEEKRVSATVDHTALAPTLTDLLGIDSPDRWQGSSALSGQQDMARFFTDYSFLLLGVRDGHYKYIYNLANETDELFDLTVDPMERHNIAGEQTELVEAYREHVIYAYHRQIGVFEDYDGYLAGTVSMPEYTPLENVAPTYTRIGWGKLRPDLSVGVTPLNIAGVGFSDGLGTHAPGRSGG